MPVNSLSQTIKQVSVWFRISSIFAYIKERFFVDDYAIDEPIWEANTC